MNIKQKILCVEKSTNCILPFKLRPYQQQAINQLFEAIVYYRINPLAESATGTGKSIMIAGLIKKIKDVFPNCKILCVTHKHELIMQNYHITSHFGIKDFGLCSAKANKFDMDHDIIFSTIGTLRRRLSLLPKINVVIIDEPHCIPDKGGSMYRKLLKHLKKQNPLLKIAGLTATPYRSDSGKIDEGKNAVFNKTVFKYDMISAIKDGYLSPLVKHKTSIQVETKNLNLAKYDYDLKDIVLPERKAMVEAIPELLKIGHDRKSWILFASNIYNCYFLYKKLKERGIKAEVITADTPTTQREYIYDKFKNGEIRALINKDVLTTGFDAPNIDFLVMFRPTLSLALYMQMAGRGVRLHPGKKNCLWIDYAGNTKIFGELENINVDQYLKQQQQLRAENTDKKKSEIKNLIINNRSIIHRRSICTNKKL